jgi:predicted dehydrogenase
LSAGKHVLCEKPFARDAAEARTVLDAAERAGVVHLLGTEFRWDAGQATLARAVASGAIGEPRLALVLMHVPMLAEPDAEVPAWWADGDSGGGWLGAHGSQVIDQLRVTLGEFEGVSAALPHVAGRAQSAEDAFIVKFRMRSGCTGVMSSTCGDRGPFLIETRVVGSKGTAWIEDVGDKVFVADAGGTHQVPVGDDLPGFGAGGPEPLPPGALHTAYDHMIAHGLDLPPYTRLCETFRDLIEGKPIPPQPKPATFADGVAQMEVLDAIRTSASTHEWVTVKS